MCNPNEEWPVLLAAATGQVEIIECLHEFGGVVTYMADSTSTPLHQASERGHIKVVEYLLQFYPRPHLHKVSEGKDINRRDSSRASALELAARSGHSEIVELLLAHGALSSLPDSKCHFVGSEQYAGVQHTLDSHRRMQFSKLSRALKSNITIDDFKLIWAGPSDFNLYTRSGSNVLMLAAQNAHAEIVTFLVQETKKLTPDMMMMSKIAMLSMDSTSIYEDEENGVAKTRTEPALQGDFPDEGQKSAEWVQSFVLHRQNLSDGHTSLHRAVLGDKCDNVCVLLTADPQGANIQDWEGNTPLHLACREGRKEMVRVFLSFSCVDVNVRNKDGLLPEACATSRQRYFKKQLEKHRKLAMSHSAPGTAKPNIRLPTPPLTTKQAHGSTTGSEDAVPTPRPLAKATPLPNEATPSHPPPKETAGSDSQASGDEHLTMSMFDDEMKRLKAELANKLAN
ncbi:hypothetical protein EMCRGX_G004091 [Ephydatia muelleri]